MIRGSIAVFAPQKTQGSLENLISKHFNQFTIHVFFLSVFPEQTCQKSNIHMSEHFSFAKTFWPIHLTFFEDNLLTQISRPSFRIPNLKEESKYVSPKQPGK